jgi:hypothetical protein
MQRPFTQQEQQRRLDKSLDASTNVPVAGPDLVPAADAARVAMPHPHQYMSKTYV